MVKSMFLRAKLNSKGCSLIPSLEFKKAAIIL